MKREWIRTALTSIGLMSIVGCASMSDIRYESTQKARAVKQYVECGKPQCEHFPHDYKLGWLDGFYAISTGGPDCPPAVAPARYWNVKQQLEDCDGRRRTYYSGWQDGATRATQFPDTHHLKIFETCECTVPRCDMPCADGSCGPCGANRLGEPFHSGLLESPANHHYEPMETLVPPAPVTPFDLGTDDDKDEDKDDEESDEEKEPKSSDEEDESSDEEQTSTPGESDEAETEDVSMIAPAIEEVATEELIDNHVDAAGRSQMVLENDANSLFGSAFDLTSSRQATVEHQATDPVTTMQEDHVTPSIANPEGVATPKNTATLGNADDQVNTAAPGEGFIIPVDPPTIPAETQAVSVEPEAKMGQQKATIVVPRPSIKQVDTAPVQHAEALKLTKSKKHSLTAKPSTTSNVIQHHTMPVKFEMIESDQNAVKLAK